MASRDDDLAPLRRTLGDLLAASRAAARLTQQQLGEAIGYARVTVATAESGHRQPAAGFWTRCDDVLGTDGALSRAYQQLAVVRAQRKHDLAERDQARRSARVAERRSLGSGRAAAIDHAIPSESGQPIEQRQVDVVGSLPSPGFAPPSMPVAEVIAYLEQQWHVLVRADNLLGPAHALGAVQEQVMLIDRLLHDGKGPTAQLWRLGAQYAESAAWLFEDLGDQATAVRWTSRALEWAHAGDDQSMVSWALFRRSQQAAASRDVPRAVALAQAALREPERLAPPMKAAIIQQHAYGLALAGDELGSLRRLDEALAFASPPDDAGDAKHGHGSFCTIGYLQLQRAHCWLLLGRPDRAAPIYRRELAAAPAAYHRDRGHGLAWFGRALAALGEVEEAAASSVQALRIGVGAGSGRIITEVRHTVRQLSSHTSLPQVAALAEALERLEPAA